MKVTNNDIANPNLQMALMELDTQELQLKAEHALMKFKKQVLENFGNYETLRMKLVEKHGQKDAEGKLLMNETKTNYVMADQGAFNKDFAELLSLEIEIDGMNFGPFEDCKLSPGPRKSLMKFFNP